MSFIATTTQVIDNSTNKFATAPNARKLDLGLILEAMENEATHGIISKDLYDALKIAEAAGLCSVDKPLPEFILYDEEIKLEYDAEKLTKEADLVLTLKAKSGDNNAMTKLFCNKLPLIISLVTPMAKKFVGENNTLENDWDFYEQEASIAFISHIIQTPIYSQGNVMFSHTNLEFAFKDQIYKKRQTSTRYTDFRKYGMIAKKVKQQMDACDVDIRKISFEQFAQFCDEQDFNLRYNSVKYKKVLYDAIQFLDYDSSEAMLSSVTSNNVDCEHGGFIDMTKTERKFSTCYDEMYSETATEENIYANSDIYRANPELSFMGQTDFTQFLTELMNDPKHGRDVKTFVAHITGEKNFNFDNIFAENAPARGNLAVTAKMMGYDTPNEVKLAMKRAKEFIISSLKKKNPTLLAELSAGRAK